MRGKFTESQTEGISAEVEEERIKHISTLNSTSRQANIRDSEAENREWLN